MIPLNLSLFLLCTIDGSEWKEPSKPEEVLKITFVVENRHYLIHSSLEQAVSQMTNLETFYIDWKPQDPIQYSIVFGALEPILKGLESCANFKEIILDISEEKEYLGLGSSPILESMSRIMSEVVSFCPNITR